MTHFFLTGIISGPVDHIVKEGELAIFNCFARGSSVHVFVNSSDPFPGRCTRPEELILLTMMLFKWMNTT